MTIFHVIKYGYLDVGEIRDLEILPMSIKHDLSIFYLNEIGKYSNYADYKIVKRKELLKLLLEYEGPL